MVCSWHLMTFGTGFFKLSHLKRFPIDMLKKTSFIVRDLAVGLVLQHRGGRDQHGRELNMQVIAKASKPQRFELLKEQGLPGGPGFYFSHPYR